LYDYPVLMAADILLYNTDAVPVGEDQKQHVELTRDLAKRFNNAYGETFRLPKAVIRKEGARIMGLDDPTKKMSKSAASESNYIALTDDPAKAAKKIMKATTDSGAEVEYDPEKKPGISNLLVIQSLLTKKDIKILVKENKGKMYGDFKKSVAETVKEFLNDFQGRYSKISNNDVRNIMKHGVEKIQPIAQETMNRVKERIGVK
jgi:tryptophanyl-tRNA synthetase